MGPQVGYYVPQILMEEDLHGPGIDARGAAFPGVNLYVELGHGRDYAWSATTATSDNVDTFAEVLCQDEVHYLYKGQCLPMEKLERTNTWTPNACDQTPPGSETLTVYRTVHGIVYARGTVKGKNVAFASARTTYFHEADSRARLLRAQRPGLRARARSSSSRPRRTSTSRFNWAYVDANHIAYYLSGWYPQRAPKTSPDFPVLGTGEYDWQGYNPSCTRSQRAPVRRRTPTRSTRRSWSPGTTSRRRGWAAADDKYAFGPDLPHAADPQLHRSGPRRRQKDAHRRSSSARWTRPATQDIRCVQLWPIAQAGARHADRTRSCRKRSPSSTRWYADGGHRRDLTTRASQPGTYQHNEAITIMDAWWPKLLEAEFRPRSATSLRPAGGDARHRRARPGRRTGRARLLRRLVRVREQGPARRASRRTAQAHAGQSAAYSRLYCGGGSLRRRAARRCSTRCSEALSVTPQQIYGHGECAETRRRAAST